MNVGMADAEERKLEVYPPIYRLGTFGKWIRGQLMKGIQAGTPVLLGIERLRSPWLDKVMSVVSFLGEEEFYTLLLPLVVWVVDARLGRLLGLLMALAFYITGFLKNMLCLPRPPSPPVVPLHACQDWSLPSHHAVLSASIPWYLWFYAAHHYSDHIGHTHMGVALFLVIALWSFCVMFSRMYLGVHSPADILTGGVVGCLLLAVWLQVDLAVDYFFRLSSTSLVFIPVAMAMLYLHPDPKPTTIIYEETISLVGVAGGVVLTYEIFPSPFPAMMESTLSWGLWRIVWCSVARYLLGMTLLLAAKVVAKTLAKELLSQLCRLVGVANVVCRKRVSEVTSRKIHYSPFFITLDQPRLQSPVPCKSSYYCGEDDKAGVDIALPVRLVTYVAMGAAAMGGAPYLFSIIGI